MRVSASLPVFPWDTLADVTAVARAHPDGIVDLSVGTPVDPVAPVIRDALADASSAPGYPTTAGTPALRASAVAALRRRYGITDLDDAAVLPAIGTKELIAWLPTLLGLGAEDVVVVPELAYPTYDVGARLAGAQVVAGGLADPARSAGAEAAVPQLAEQSDRRGARCRASAQGRRAGRESAACWSPPTSATSGLGWDAEPVSVLHPSVCDGDHTGAACGALAVEDVLLAGYRAGFVAGDAAVVAELLAVRKHAGMMVPTPMQAAMVAALDDDAHEKEQKERYAGAARRSAACRRAAGFAVDHSEAGLYLWATRGEPCRDTVALVRRPRNPGGAGRVLRTPRREARPDRVDRHRRTDRRGRRAAHPPLAHEQAERHRRGHRRSPIGHVELVEHPEQVRLDRGLADVELPPDVGVGITVGHQVEHLEFTRRQHRRTRSADQMQKAVGDRGRQHRSPLGRIAYRIGEFGPRGVLQQVARRPRFDRSQDVGIGLVGGDDDDPGARRRAQDALGGGHAVDVRHAQIHENHVGPQGLGHRDGLGPRARLPNDGQVGFGVEHPAQPLADDGMVVDQQDFDRHAGTSTAIVVPPPGVGPMDTRPPAWATRVRMPRSPKPSACSGRSPIPLSDKDNRTPSPSAIRSTRTRVALAWRWSRRALPVPPVGARRRSPFQVLGRAVDVEFQFDRRLRRKRLALAADRCRQRRTVQRGGRQFGHHGSCLGEVLACGRFDELQLPLRFGTIACGFGLQLRLHGLCQHHDAREALSQRVVDLVGQSRALSADPGFP